MMWMSVPAHLAKMAPSAWMGPTPTPACAQKVQEGVQDWGQETGEALVRVSGT